MDAAVPNGQSGRSARVLNQYNYRVIGTPPLNGIIRTLNGIIRTLDGIIRTLDDIIRTLDGIIRTLDRHSDPACMGLVGPRQPSGCNNCDEP